MIHEIVLKGVPAATGIVYGQCFILEKGEFVVAKRTILSHEVSSEIARFHEALENTRKELSDLRIKITEQLDENQAQIFDAHLMVLSDPLLTEDIEKSIRQHKYAAEYVFAKAIKKYAQIFEKISDEYLRERAMDIQDIGRRVLKHLMQENKTHEFENIQQDLIIVAHDLSPSDAVSMYTKKIMAFITDIGGRTSHTAILAKSMGVPAVVGLKDATLRISNMDYVIVDGQKGLVILNPTEHTRQQYLQEQTKIAQHLLGLDDIKDLPAETMDGKPITLLANMELIGEVAALKKYAAQGVGLFRTEFLFMNRMDLPSEEEQYQAYRRVIEAVGSNPVTIRTLDLGGDKFISTVDIPREMSPFLGCRAIRFCLQQPAIFKTQLRAILRASVHGKLQMMYPMISGVGELREANDVLNQVKLALQEEKIPFDEKMKVGVMIEIPSAVMTADMLAKETDFFSIGTNDLIQYTLAVDRVNEKTADLYEPAHPAILRMIQRTVDAAHNEDIPVSLCGEMGSDPRMAFLLLGIGIDSLSMSPASILPIKKMIRSCRKADAKRVLDEAMQLPTAREIEEFVESQMKKLRVI